MNGPGALAWSQTRDKSLLSATQWFQDTGEVWGVWPDALILHNDRLTFTPDDAGAALERFLENHFATFERLSARKPWRVEVGAHGLTGTFLPGNYRGGFRGLADQVVHRQDRVRGTAGEIREIAYAFSAKIYDAYGAPNLGREAYETMIQGR